jgi:propanol-preferring alcohol dehydrogenase
MKAAVLSTPSSISQSPLKIGDVPTPEPKAGHALLKVLACGVCRTDLHIVEGELPQRMPRVIPGHQIVGEIVGGDFDSGTVDAVPGASGSPVEQGSTKLFPGTRVGVSWIGGTDGTCAYCVRNMCIP